MILLPAWLLFLACQLRSAAMQQHLGSNARAERIDATPGQDPNSSSFYHNCT